MSEPTFPCESCGTLHSASEVSDAGGYCPQCDADYDERKMFADLVSRYTALEAELATVKKVAYGNMELLDENRNLQAELAKLRAGQEPVAWRMWNGKTRRFCYSNAHGKRGWEALYTAPQPSAVPEEKE